MKRGTAGKKGGGLLCSYENYCVNDHNESISRKDEFWKLGSGVSYYNHPVSVYNWQNKRTIQESCRYVLPWAGYHFNAELICDYVVTMRSEFLYKVNAINVFSFFFAFFQFIVVLLSSSYDCGLCRAPLLLLLHTLSRRAPT